MNYFSKKVKIFEKDIYKCGKNRVEINALKYFVFKWLYKVEYIYIFNVVCFLPRLGGNAKRSFLECMNNFRIKFQNQVVFQNFEVLRLHKF